MNNSNPAKSRPPSIIETERLILRTPRLEDAFALLELAKSDPVFAQATFGDAPRALDSTCTAIARMLSDTRAGSAAWWVVEEKTSQRVVGISGFTHRARALGPINALASDVIGYGYARETIEALLLQSASLHELHPDRDTHESAMEEMPTASTSDSHTRWYWHRKATRPLGRRCA